MSGPAISCEGVSKRFRIPNAQHMTLKGRVLHPFARTGYTEFQALDDVSFEVERGEFFGIVGRNGSGKSTLLKMIAGIYRADSGRLEIDGSIAPFIELGVGFNDELNGRENLFLNGALLGLTRRQLEERYDAIVAFAELEDFMELKLRNFSSGMQVRLAFSIALQAGADILLTDEVLAVGDERFQRKCFDVFREQKRLGQTVIFVSHDMAAVSRFCDRGMLLERGRVAAYGRIGEVVREYHRLNMGETGSVAYSGESEIREAWTEDEHGERCNRFEAGEPITIAVRMFAAEPITDPILSATIRDRFEYCVFGTNTDLLGMAIGTIDAGEEVIVRFRLTNRFAGGAYHVAAGLAWPTSGDDVHRLRDACSFDSSTSIETAGVIDIPHDAIVDRHAASKVSVNPPS